MSWAIWITGLPASARSAIARASASALSTRGEPVQLLEFEAVRRSLAPRATDDATARECVYRAVVVIARALTAAGIPVIVDASGDRRAWRDLARVSITSFAEVQLDGACEPAPTPELRIDTIAEPVEAAADRVVALARTLRHDAGSARPAGGFTVWIGGRPGSGKTTIVSGVCEQLTGRGVPVAVLDTHDFVISLAGRRDPTPFERETATLAIVVAAGLLSDAGRAVIIDGAPPFRDAARVARERLAGFAEIELVCPPDICRTRERAVRWNLVPCPGVARPYAGPDLGLDYEPAPAPDLRLFTDVVDELTAAGEVLTVVDRLAREARERRRSCA